MKFGATREERSRLMAAIRPRGNRSTELVLLAALRAARLKGWRRHFKVTGTPDFAFPKAKVAIFLDGCFWHGCPLHFRCPQKRTDWWRQKIEANVNRDKAAVVALESKGWTALRFWEHELLSEPERCVVRIRDAVMKSEP